jgi:hypothetical protein
MIENILCNNRILEPVKSLHRLVKIFNLSASLVHAVCNVAQLCSIPDRMRNVLVKEELVQYNPFFIVL